MFAVTISHVVIQLTVKSKLVQLNGETSTGHEGIVPVVHAIVISEATNVTGFIGSLNTTL
jgi:hypothetical protein